jgi:leucyl aminopeptidase (aminopeptidase T)
MKIPEVVFLFAIGMEPRDEYMSYELGRGALTLARDVMLVKPGENVVITADSCTDRRVVESTAAAVFAIGGQPAVIYYPTAPNSCMQPYAPIAAAVEHADVWIEYAYSYVMHSPCFRAALEAGCRYICLTGMDVMMMVRTISSIDYGLVIELGETLQRIVQSSDEVIVKSGGGTNLKGYNRGRRVRLSGKRATEKGYPVMLAGQISWNPIEETINGELVFDGAAWPPPELGKLSSPIAMTLKDGRVYDIRGGRDAAVFKLWMEGLNDPENMYRLAHYSLGFNPGVTSITGRIVEDERVFGCIEFGIGSQGKSIMAKEWAAAGHTDGIVLNPTIILDGVALEENGVYIHPEVREICKKLGVAGY